MRLLFRLIAGLAGLLAVFLLLTFAIVKPQMGSFHRTAVGPVPPGSMPVLVVDRDREGRPIDAQIVRYHALGTLPQGNYNRTFEARAGEERRINDLIAAGCRGKVGTGFGDDSSSRHPGFVQRQTGAGEAVMRVEDTSDSDHVSVGWYTVNGRTIVARARQSYFGPGLMFISMAFSGVATCALLVLAGIAIMARRNLLIVAPLP